MGKRLYEERVNRVYYLYLYKTGQCKGDTGPGG